MESLKNVIVPFYTKCLTVNAETDVAAMMDRILAGNFESKGSADTKSKEQLIGQVQYFWKLVPDLKWEIQETLEDGNRIVVRSMASGTPNGDFMGVKTTGSRSFKIMTIDIHTVKDGQVVEVYHLEDWPTAIKQVSA